MDDKIPDNVPADSRCTQVCGKFGKSCAKTILVRVYHEKDQVNFRELYAILDEQSNRSLASSEFFYTSDEYGSTVEYSLRPCAGYITASGRQPSGYIVEALDRSAKLKLPTLIECDNVPNNTDEITTPEVVVGHPHLVNIAKDIPPLNESADVMLLIGRDLPSAHHVIDQRIGDENAPYAQMLNLGWVVVREVCLGTIYDAKVLTSIKHTSHVMDIQLLFSIAQIELERC